MRVIIYFLYRRVITLGSSRLEGRSESAIRREENRGGLAMHEQIAAFVVAHGSRYME